MFNAKTVVVLGAGASAEAKLPTGVELTGEISSLLNISFEGIGDIATGDHVIVGAMRDLVRRPDNSHGDINPLINAAWKIRAGMPLAPSIDSFMDTHSADEHVVACGKLAIVRSILKAERKSPLGAVSNGLDFGDLSSKWYGVFWRMLVSDCRLADLERRLANITFVVFNYDRCLEQFLLHAIQTYFDVDAPDAAAIVNALPIFHPYGTVGVLPSSDKAPRVAFGHEPRSRDLLNLTANIKTFTESADPVGPDIQEIRKRINEAGMIVTLGFAFHRQNLKLLGRYPGSQKPLGAHNAQLFGTALGMSESDCQVVASQLGDLGRLQPGLIRLHRNLDCAGLLTEYRHTFSQ